MQEQSFYDDNGSLVYPEEIGAFCGQRKYAAPRGVTRSSLTRTRTPVTSIFRKVGKPSVLGDLQTWWASIPKNWRWGILGGAAALGLVLAATGKKEKEGKGDFSWLKK